MVAIPKPADRNSMPKSDEVAGERFRIPADATFNIEHARAGAEEELEFQLIWTRQ
jgi:hypothetical protein